MAAPAVEGKVTTALRAVFRRVEGAAKRAGRQPEDVRVVAVGKTKPVSLIRDLYDAGHRCFGENYVQEFIQKAPQIVFDEAYVLFCSFLMISNGILSDIFKATKSNPF
ncbi:hypothetical protein IEQ34_008012 [Dendrobium chrysotoxum]|uniref:Uncharacterized protein n=1 Tax=Dendrobium chrysotoxum TaxID=161865 RepID=A0AAV7H7E0_DENCH|nr:hypothetical protein IEQ34_008012 [Dendrobium chrysotoxum]